MLQVFFFIPLVTGVLLVGETVTGDENGGFSVLAINYDDFWINGIANNKTIVQSSPPSVLCNKSRASAEVGDFFVYVTVNYPQPVQVNWINIFTRLQVGSVIVGKGYPLLPEPFALCSGPNNTVLLTLFAPGCGDNNTLYLVTIPGGIVTAISTYSVGTVTKSAIAKNFSPLPNTIMDVGIDYGEYPYFFDLARSVLWTGVGGINILKTHAQYQVDIWIGVNVSNPNSPYWVQFIPVVGMIWDGSDRSRLGIYDPNTDQIFTLIGPLRGNLDFFWYEVQNVALYESVSVALKTTYCRIKLNETLQNCLPSGIFLDNNQPANLVSNLLLTYSDCNLVSKINVMDCTLSVSPKLSEQFLQLAVY